jgi:hypothetical protein
MKPVAQSAVLLAVVVLPIVFARWMDRRAARRELAAFKNRVHHTQRA